MKSLVIPKTITDLATARNNAIKAFEQALRLLDNMKKELHGFPGHLLPYDTYPRISINEFTKDLDTRCWRSAFEQTRLSQYMDAKARKEFDCSLNKEHIPFTLENIRDNLISAANNMDEFMARGVVELFLSFSKNYQTNRNHKFRVGKKNIVPYMVSPGFGNGNGYRFSYSSGSSDRVNDLDRVTCIMTEKPFVAYRLVTAVEAAWSQGKLYEDENFRMVPYNNGNLHLTIKNDDLIDKINKIISDYYDGKALA